MKVWNGIESLPADPGSLAITIGNYDGVHLGHRAIIESVLRAARHKGLTSLVVTFEPHPLTVVAPSRRPELLQTRRQKLVALEDTGVDAVLIVRFDASLAALSGQEFFSRVLCGPMRFDSIHVGGNFRFGRERHGDIVLLKEIGKKEDFDVVVVPHVNVDDSVVSSSAIRAAVKEGDVELARRMLGRPFSVTGRIVQGDGRGRALDIPTANLELENELPPARGVYVSETVVLATRHPSVTNVGVRPTFGGESLTVESHLVEFDGELYGERAEVRFLARLRDEQRFSSPEELADQIARDRAAAVAYFQNATLASS